MTAADLLGRRRTFIAGTGPFPALAAVVAGVLLGRSREPEAVAQAEPAIA